VAVAWRWGGTILANSGFAPSVGTWHHYVYTFDGTTHRLYIDGADVGSSTQTPQVLIPVEGNLGRYNNGEYFNGWLDEARYSLSPISPGWIATEYANQSNPSGFLTYGSERLTTDTISVGVCETSYTLDDGYPAGGIYTGPGVSGNTFNASVAGVGTHTLTYTYGLGACSGTSDTRVFIVTPAPSAPLASDVACCVSNILDLTATGTNLNWYSDPGLTTNVGFGSPFATGQTTVGNYTYYVTQTVNGCESPATEVTLTISNTTPGGTLTATPVCTGENTLLTLTGYAGNVLRYEYSTVSGAGPWTNITHVYDTLTYGPITSDIWFRALVQAGTCPQSYSSVVAVTVSTPSVAPTSASSDRNNICPNDGNIVLSYAGGTLGTGATAEWYSDGGFTTNIGSGNNLTIATPATSTTYFVRFEGDCNTTSAASVVVVVEDVTAPVPDVDPLADVTAECSVSSLSAPTATDNCVGSVTGTHNATLPITAQGTTVVTWTYDDGSGNTSTQNQNVIIDDVTSPVFAAPPADVSVDCIGDIPAMVNLAWTDNCDGAGVVAGTDVSDGLSCPETITRTWTYTDGGGNPASVTQLITVDDNIAPTGSAPADVSVACIEDVPAVDITSVTASDNCAAGVTVTHVSDVSDGASCPEVITRTYRITDACSNSIDVVQLITVDDNIAPTGSAPADVSVACIEDVPAVDITSVTASDNCAAGVTVTHVSDVSDGASCPEVITRTYRITDACSNSIDVVQLITVDDNIAPTGSAPADVSVACIEDVPAVDITSVTASDNCAAGVTVTHVSDVSDGASCPEVITRTYRITDACSNSIDVVQLITVDDNIAPTGSAPADVSVACIEDVPAVDITSVTASDNCAAGVTVTHVSDVSDGASCPEVITRTYRITDACSNSIDVVQLITVDDNIAPTGSAPADVSVACIEDVPAVDITSVTASDNCAAGVTVTHVSDVSDGASCPEVITRTYRITDACSNSIDVVQLITVDDNIAPTGSAPADVSVACIEDVPAVDITSVTASDNCAAGVTVTHVSDVSDGASCPEVITRTYRITDACSNSIDVVQLITVDDNIAPTGSAPADVSVACIEDVPAVDITSVTASDNCAAGVTVTHVSDVSDGASCPEVITRTYRITDACSNSIDVVQLITVDDNIAPTGSAPADVSVACIEDVPAVDITSVTASDNCAAGVTVTHVSDVSDGASCPEVITRTYRITDACSNSIDVVQLITVDDNIAPTGSAPADVSVACIEDVPAVDITSVTASDNCAAGVTVTHVSDVSDGASCPEVITRTYRITDACSNSIDVVQLITVDDNIAPTGSAPADVSVACIEDVPAVDITSVTASDNCAAGVTVTHVSDVSDGASCPEVITRTYRITDACSNSIDVVQLITVDDNIAPTGSAPADVSVACIEDVPAVDITSVTASDNCAAGVTVTHVSDVSDGASCPEVITRTYRITDACSNSIDVVQLITVDDNIAPTGSAPADVSVACIEDVPAVDITSVTASDNCAAGVTVTHVSDVSDGASCPEVITRTYRITDACSNSIDVVQLITVDDNIAPTGSAPADVSVACIEDVPAVDITSVTASDNCAAGVTVTHVSDVSDGASCPEVITRTYRITDACSNSIDVVQLITVDDNIAPTGSAPADVSVACIEDVPAVDITSVTASDNCAAGVTVTHVSDVSDGASCPEVITRTYRITDACSNSIDVVQLITVDDNIAPTGSAPADVSVACIEDVPAVDITSVTASDNCAAGVTVTHVSDVSDGASCPEVITRTYRITDACSNSIDVVQLITVDDNIAPTGSAPADVSVACIEDVPAVDITSVTASDNCAAGVTVTHVSDVSDGASCPEVITRTYRITDACSNSIDVVQLITVDDNIAPTGSAPADVSVACIEDVPAVDITSVTASDNCAAGVTVTHVSDVSDGASCPEVITRTYRITDACSNSIDVVQLITVDDNIAPTGSAPADVSVACIEDVPAVDITSVTASDNCAAGVTVTHVSDVSDGASCPEVITRTYRITDACSNSIDVVQLITVDDNIAPTGSAPADVSVACIEDVPAVDITSVTASDNCAAGVTVTHVSDVSDGASCPEVITRTYRITDACSNSIDVVQLITVDDNIAPTGSAPADVSVACIEDVPAVDITSVTASDNCAAGVTVTHVSDVSDGASCPEVITRTYRITDACSNSIDVVQLITVDDNIAPTGSAPADVSVACIEDVPAVDITSVTASDNCAAGVTVTHVSDVSDGASCPEVITRTYRITDACSNSIDVVQLITVDDNIAPTGSAPADVSVACIEDVPAVDITSVTASDNCAAGVTVTHVSDVSDGASCPEVITRTYRITDACSNSIDVVQLITVDDNIAPTGSAPADVSVACIEDVPAVDITSVTASDNCAAGVTVTHVSDVSDGASCPEVITRTYRITDACSNSIDVVQLITVDDNIAPTGSAPADVSVACIEDVPAVDITSVTASDNCAAGVTVTHVSDVSDGASCPEVITRTYRITDACSNSIDVVQLITVDDNIAPTGVPQLM
jgi:hypothetical protein